MGISPLCRRPRLQGLLGFQNGSGSPGSPGLFGRREKGREGKLDSIALDALFAIARSEVQMGSGNEFLNFN